MTDKEKQQAEKKIRAAWREYKKCAAGNPANCDKCIGCAGKRAF